MRPGATAPAAQRARPESAKTRSLCERGARADLGHDRIRQLGRQAAGATTPALIFGRCRHGTIFAFFSRPGGTPSTETAARGPPPPHAHGGLVCASQLSLEPNIEPESGLGETTFSQPRPPPHAALEFDPHSLLNPPYGWTRKTVASTKPGQARVVQQSSLTLSQHCSTREALTRS
jgi:hypothetical protein